MFSKTEIRSLYRKRAKAYDFSANLYYLIGFREAHYRQLAINALNLQHGDRVAEIGCGTGLNFPYVIDKIGKEGRLIGIDLTDRMLEQALDRVQRYQWNNVELVQGDAAHYEFPSGLQGVYSSFALTLVPEFEVVIEKASLALAPSGRLVILDLKRPEHWPEWLVRFGVWITRPFGVTLDLAERQPWAAMRQYFSEVHVQELYGGFAYIVTGIK